MVERVERRHKASPYEGTRAAIREALARVERNAAPEWKVAARSALVWCTHRFAEFTSDDVWDRLDVLKVPRPRTAAALGPVFRQAQHDGLIENTGRLQPVSKFSQIHRSLTIWRSL
jgi:hypothetical protein